MPRRVGMLPETKCESAYKVVCYKVVCYKVVEQGTKRLARSSPSASSTDGEMVGLG